MGFLLVLRSGEHQEFGELVTLKPVFLKFPFLPQTDIDWDGTHFFLLS